MARLCRGSACLRRLHEQLTAASQALRQPSLTALRFSPAAAAGRADSEEGSLAASNERTHHRQVAAALLERWARDMDAARPCVLTPALFTALLHAYSHSGQAMQVLLLMRDAFGCQLSPQTSSSLGGGSGSESGGQAAADSSSTATAANSGSSGSQDAGLEAAIDESSSSSSSSAPASSIAGPLSPRTLERAQLAPSLPAFNAAISACTRVGHRHMADAVALLRCMLVSAQSSPACALARPALHALLHSRVLTCCLLHCLLHCSPLCCRPPAWPPTPTPTRRS